MEYLICSRFNMVNDPDSRRGQLCMARKDWWDERVRILKKYWIPAVKRVGADFDIVFPIAPNADPDHYKSLVELADKHGIHTTIDYDERFQLREPAEWICENYDDDLILVFLDSDDLLDPEYFYCLSRANIREGFVGLLRSGYIYSLKIDELAEYRSKSSQFHARFFPQEVLGSAEDLLKYENKWGMNTNHQKLNRQCPRSEHLAGNHFLMLDHSENSTQAWYKPNTQRHIREIITGKERTMILGRFLGEKK